VDFTFYLGKERLQILIPRRRVKQRNWPDVEAALIV